MWQFRPWTSALTPPQTIDYARTVLSTDVDNTVHKPGAKVDTSSAAKLDNLWNQTLSSMRPKLARDEFESWIRPMSPVAIDGPVEGQDGADGQVGQKVELSVPNRMFASWVEQNYLDLLSKAWVEAGGKRVTFSFTWGPGGLQGELFKNLNRVREEAPKPAPTKSKGLIARYGFDSFVVGQSNQFAHAASMAVAGQPGTLYNPFFLYGGVGLGKTHLANAIGKAVVANTPEARVLFLSAESFTNQLIDAIARNTTPAFKNRLRKVDLLIIDDVQFLARRERTQEEFFHLFNALYEAGRQIVLTSDTFPNELQGVEERLCNRFGWGLVADIQSPDLETRIAILERKARSEAVDMPMEVAVYIAERVDSNIRDLEGALTRISAYASLNGLQITRSLAEDLLSGVSGESPREVSMEDVERGVTRHFGLQPGELAARRRTKKVAEARQVAMYIMRKHLGASFPTIGSQIGGRDHSTVIHACNAVEKRRGSDTRFRHMIDTLIKMLGCG